MHRQSLPGHGLRIAVAVLVSLAVAPAAGAEDGVPVLVDPIAMTTAIVEASLAGVPELPLESTLPAEPPAATVPEAVAAAAEPIPAQEPQPTPPPPQPQVPDPETALEELSPPLEPDLAPVEEPQYQPEPPQYQPPEPVTAPVAAPPPPEAAEEEWTWDWSWSCGDAPAQLPAVKGDNLPDTWNWNWAWNCGGSGPTLANNETEKTTQYQPALTQYHPINVNVSIRIASPGDDGPVTQTNVVVLVEAPTLGLTAQTPVATAAVPPAGPPEPPQAVPDGDQRPQLRSPRLSRPPNPRPQAPKPNRRPCLPPRRTSHRRRPPPGAPGPPRRSGSSAPPRKPIATARRSGGPPGVHCPRQGRR